LREELPLLSPPLAAAAVVAAPLSSPPPSSPRSPRPPVAAQWHCGLATFDHVPAGRGFTDTLSYLDGANECVRSRGRARCAAPLSPRVLPPPRLRAAFSPPPLQLLDVADDGLLRPEAVP
jgi:hypothetical protein